MNIQSLLKQAQKMQIEIGKAEKALKERSYCAIVNNGVVKIECNGGYEVTKVEIDDSLLTADNKEVLQDMIALGVNEVIKKAVSEREQVMNQLTGGVKLPGAF